MILYDYWRSTASYRVRIGLALKGLDIKLVSVDLREGAHKRPSFGEVNPQHFVPALACEEGMLTQSLAILEYLDERYPQRRILSTDPWRRAQERSLAQIIACDVHPLCNLRVLNELDRQGHSGDATRDWMTRWMSAGFAALEQAAEDTDYLGGKEPMLPDLVLVPQMYNARRFDIPLGAYPRLLGIVERCEAIPAFRAAAPS